MKHLKSYKNYNESLLAFGAGILLSMFGVKVITDFIISICKNKIPNRWLETLTSKDDLKVSVSEFSDRFFIRLLIDEKHELDFRIIKNTKTLITPTGFKVNISKYIHWRNIVVVDCN